jgi:hypothetical protein
MPDKNTHPWVCIKVESVDSIAAQIRQALRCDLYLMYLSDGTDTGSQQVVTDANNTWARAAAALQDSLVPLCSATVRVSDGGIKWNPCGDSVFADPGPGNQALPYALWFLCPDRDIDVPVVQPSADGGLRGRLVLKDGKITQGDEPYSLATFIAKIKPNSILAEALALQWLLAHRPCNTKAAILKRGLLKALCPDKAKTSPADDASPGVIMETA